MAIRESEAAQIFEQIAVELTKFEKTVGLGNADELRSLIEKLARQPAAIMPRRAVASAPPAPSSHAVDVLLRWVPGAPPETAEYLRRCARLEAER